MAGASGAILGFGALYLMETIEAVRVSSSGIRYYEYEFARLSIYQFLATSWPGVIVGAGLGALCMSFFLPSKLATKRLSNWLLAAGLFGLILMFGIGLFKPIADLFYVYANGLLGRVNFFDALFREIVGIPIFAYVYGINGLYIGLVTGIFFLVVTHISYRSLGAFYKLIPFGIAVVLSVIPVLILFMSPGELFRFLVESFGRVDIP